MSRFNNISDFLRYLKSFVLEEVVERGESKLSPDLRVEYAYGQYHLNTKSVNYAFGFLDTVFRRAFKRLKLETLPHRKVLLLGLGAGNVPHILLEYAPDYHVTGVELDPEVIRLGKKHFNLGENPGLEIVEADAKAFVMQCEAQFEMIIIDLFVDESVPKFAESKAFLKQVAALLLPGGLLMFNRLGHREDLKQASLKFLKKMQQVLPDARYEKAQMNLMLIYEKP